MSFDNCKTVDEVNETYQVTRKALITERDAPYKDRFKRLSDARKVAEGKARAREDKPTIAKVKDWGGLCSVFHRSQRRATISPDHFCQAKDRPLPARLHGAAQLQRHPYRAAT